MASASSKGDREMTQVTLRVTQSVRVQKGMPSGQLVAHLAACKGEKELDEAVATQQTIVHKLPALPPNPPNQRVYCELDVVAK